MLHRMQKPVLIVIDMLNDFLDLWEAKDRAALVASINELVAINRQAQCPVIWVRQEFEPDLHDAFPEMRAKGISMLIRGTTGCLIDADLAVDPDDRVLVKKRYSAFFRTALDEVLNELKPDVLVLAGINTHACVRTTAIDAYQRDWPVVLAANAIDSYDRGHHESSLRYMRGKLAEVMTNAEIQSALTRR